MLKVCDGISKGYFLFGKSQGLVIIHSSRVYKSVTEPLIISDFQQLCG